MKIKLIPLKHAPLAYKWVHKGTQNGYKITIKTSTGQAYAEKDGKHYKIVPLDK